MENTLDLKLVKELENATRKAIQSLMNKHHESFYYCSLITDGEGHSPLLSAWSKEALERKLLTVENPIEARKDLKWSYVDSPFYAYGEEYFNNIKDIFEARTRLITNEEDDEREFELRINSMEKVMANLDKEGLFGKGNKRLEIVINAEVMPPDYSNTERAKRLNPKKALNEWLEEIAEEEEEEEMTNFENYKFKFD